MVEVVSKIFVKEDKVDELIELFKEMVEPTKKEEGYIQYEMYQDEENPTILIVIEQWESKENFDMHLKSEHFERIVPKMIELMVEDTEMNVAYRVA